jgi:hypothetical protein
MTDTSTRRRRQIRTPWDAGAPPLTVVPIARTRLQRLLGRVPTRRELIAGQVQAAMAELGDPSLDELARRLGTDAGDVDIWQALGCADDRSRRLVFRVLDGWVEVPRQ